MKIRNFATRLNLIHLSIFISILIFFLLVNFFLIHDLYVKNTIKRLTVQCKQLNTNIISESEKIEELSNFITYEFIKTNDITLFEENKRSFFTLNKFVTSIDIVKIQELTKENLVGWNFNLSKNTSPLIASYFTPINSEYFLKLTLHETWFSSLFNSSILDETSNAYLLNTDKKVIWTLENIKDKYSFQKKIEILLKDQQEEKTDKKLFDGMNSQQIKLSKSSKSDLFFVIKNPKNQFYVVLNHPIGVFNDYLILYFRNISVIILVALVLFSIIVIQTDKRFTKPFTLIVENLKKNKDLQMLFTDKMNESTIINKSIEVLQNQLNQYRTGLEKNILNNQKIENDLRLAKRLQSNILPKDTTEVTENKNFKIFAHSEAAFDIGGDLYDYFMLDNNRLLITIADVAGKGIPASLFMIYTQTLLRSVIREENNVAAITEKLNNRLIEEKISDLFVTIFIGILEIKTGEFSFCNAAHNYPLLIKERGTIEELSETHGIPIGIYPNRNYSSSTITLEPDDQLFLYTDGLIDTCNEDNMKFGVDVVKYNLMGTWFQEPKEVVEKISNCVLSFRGNKNPEDDLTLMSIKYTPET